MRKQHSAAFKASVVVEALEALTAHFQRGAVKEEKTQTQERRIAELYEEIGRLTTPVTLA